MKMFLISDNVDTQIGMRLAGVDGVVVHDLEALHEAIDGALADSENGILMFTERAAAIDREYVSSLKIKLATPLIIEIPDRHGSLDIADSINTLVQESIGLKL